MSAFSDHQSSIYFNAMFAGEVPAITTNLARLEEHAAAQLTPEAQGYIVASAGNGSTARANVAAFERWRIVPRMLVDHAVRSGPDVFKALALGAEAVLLGRPYLYGLALAGQAGVEHVARCLMAELDLTLGGSGYASVGDLSPASLTRV